ncbi:DUF2293 domain-containing protein [Marinoscillum furvescens]|uniref:Uncharacterized protein DUF2293 n=1 Tax=Marinoscillum furvescens DSM 4134 TaxID=1122208 RepID=A0A3D9L1H9_MARFU|nr:DUF2293 domain-containing protein [Marinoscillum furvescens]RED97905.1 uncharacterized protein DUF2293 [Marinoscillum furvescens DSM 4134]
MSNIRVVSQGPAGYITNEYGIHEKPPAGWSFLPAGDAAVTRKVTAMGECWRVQIKKGRRTMSKGIWAPTHHITQAKEAVDAMRSAPDYAKKQASAAKSRARKQEAYRQEFTEAVTNYLNFPTCYEGLQKTLAELVTEHAIPIGSGTVARTSQIPIEDRAGKAVIAWMRHHTTNYDNLKIARVKGERRKVRRQLAQQSVKVLNSFRKGGQRPPSCPLLLAVNKLSK